VAEKAKGTEKELGHLGSSIYNIGLALMRLNPIAEGATEFKVGDFTVHPFVPSWWPAGHFQ